MNDKKRSAVTEFRAFYASTKRADKVVVEKRDFYSISYRYCGKILIEVDGKSMFSHENSITFVPKGLTYTTEVLEDTRMALVHFKLNSDIDFRNAAVMSVSGPEIRLLFERLIRHSHADSTVDFRSMADLYELLFRLESLSDASEGKITAKKLKGVKTFIERNYSDPLLSVSSIADSFGVSSSYLRREFSAAYGTSPISFLKSVRIENAKNMLESGYMSIAEIAEQSGFSSSSYFIQVFHKAVGVSPDKYRRRIRD